MGTQITLCPSAVCFPPGEEEMGSPGGSEDERLRGQGWECGGRGDRKRGAMCGVKACVTRSQEVDLLISFKALESDSRDVILLGSQRIFPRARGAGLATEVRPERDKHLGKEAVLLLL